MRASFAVLVLLATFPAYGQDPSLRERRAAALGLCHAKKPAGAVQLREAYEQSRQPEILFDLGGCQEQLGQDEQALKTYQDYLKLPFALRIAEANARIDGIQQRHADAPSQAPANSPRYVLLPTNQKAATCRQKCSTAAICPNTPSKGIGWAMAQDRCFNKEFACLSACPGALVKQGNCPAASTTTGYNCLEERTRRVLPGLLMPGRF